MLYAHTKDIDNLLPHWLHNVKPGCLMSHKWLHTIDCKVLNENNTSEKVAKCLVMPQASLDLPSRDHAAQFLT